MSILIKGMEMPKACYECRMYEAAWGFDRQEQNI